MVSSDETARTLSAAHDDALVWGLGYRYGLLLIYGSTEQSAEGLAAVCLLPMRSPWAQGDRDTSPAQFESVAPSPDLKPTSLSHLSDTQGIRDMVYSSRPPGVFREDTLSSMSLPFNPLRCSRIIKSFHRVFSILSFYFSELAAMFQYTHVRDDSYPNVDNFEHYWTDIVDALVRDDSGCEAVSDSQSDISSPDSSGVTDMSPRLASQPGPSSSSRTSKRSKHRRRLKKHPEAPELFLFSDVTNGIVDYSRLTLEQDAALQTYLFRTQLLSAFLCGTRGDEHTNSTDQDVGNRGETACTQADDESLGSEAIEHPAYSSAYRRRTRLDKAEATRRARHRE